MNSTYRCMGCRRHVPRPEYRRIGLGAVCSQECLVRTAQKKPKKQPPSGRARAETGDIPQATRGAVLVRDRNRCRMCGATHRLHLHHIVYRSSGVDHQPHNLIVLCDEHHSLVHSNKRFWQPILRAYIWRIYVEGRRQWLAVLEREFTSPDGGSTRS